MTDKFKDYLMDHGLSELNIVKDVKYTIYSVCSECSKTLQNLWHHNYFYSIPGSNRTDTDSGRNHTIFQNQTS